MRPWLVVTSGLSSMASSEEKCHSLEIDIDHGEQENQPGQSRRIAESCFCDKPFTPSTFYPSNFTCTYLMSGNTENSDRMKEKI